MYKKILAAIDLTPNEMPCWSTPASWPALLLPRCTSCTSRRCTTFPAKSSGAADSVWYPVRTISHRMIGE